MDATAAAYTLRRLRERRGWSWSDLARALASAARDLGIARVAAASQASIRRTVARWERPNHPTVPDEQYQVLLAHLYATRDGVPSTGPGSDLEALLGALAEHGAPPARIEQLRQDTRVAVGDAAASFRPARLTPEVLDALRTELAYLQRQVGTAPFVRVQIALAPVVTTCRRLLAIAPAGSLRAELCDTAADILGFAARCAFETRDDSTAHTMYGHALAAAVEAPDPWQWAVLTTSRAMVTLHGASPGAIDEAQNLAATARRAADRSSSTAVRARAHALQAETAARAGHRRQALSALRLAELLSDRDTTGDPGGTRFTPARLHGFAGLIHLYADNLAQAEEYLTSAVADLEGDHVQGAIIRADLALTQLRRGDPESAASTLHHVIETAATTGSRVPGQRLRQVRRALKPWDGEAFTAEVDDHLYTALLS